MAGGADALWGGITGTAVMISGGNDLQQAKKQAKNLKRPTYSIQEPIYDNQYLAENNAQQGLSDSSKELFIENADRGLSGSLDALLKSGGGLNSVSDLYSAYGNNLEGLVMADDEMRFKKQQILMNQNERMAQEEDKVWQTNTWAPFADEAQRIAELRALGNNKKLAGASMLAQTGASNSADWGNGKPKSTDQDVTQNRKTSYGDTQTTQTYDQYQQDADAREQANARYVENYTPRSNSDTNYLLNGLYNGNKWNK